MHMNTSASRSRSESPLRPGSSAVAASMVCPSSMPVATLPGAHRLRHGSVAGPVLPQFVAQVTEKG